MILNEAFPNVVDQGRLTKCTSPSSFWRETKVYYSAKTAGQQNVLRSKLSNFKIPRGANPLESLVAIEALAADLMVCDVGIDEKHAYNTSMPFPSLSTKLR